MTTYSVSFAGLVRELGRIQGDRAMLDFDGRTVTFGEFDDRTERLSAALAGSGVAPGDRVAFLDKNSVEHFEVMAATAKRRAVMVPLNWRLAPAELVGIVNDAGARLLVVGPEYLPVVEKIRDELAGVETVVVTGGVGPGGDLVDYEAWIAAAAPEPDPGEQDPDDVLFQMYTSGTTGLPKGAMLTSANFLAHIRELSEVWGLSRDSVNIVAMPAFHIGGTYDFLIAYVVGARSILLREMDPVRVAWLIPARRVTHVFLVPAALQLLVDLPGAADTDFSSVRTFLYGASPISETLLTRALALMPEVRFFQVYGLTESGNVGYLDAEFHDPVGRPELLRSCGKVEPWIESRVVDAGGTDVPTGEVGELWLRSVQTMKGYWNNPEGTAAAITEDGWLRTGDAVYVDAEGFMFLHDRIKDVIISGAENVYPAEVENALTKHPGVADAAVVGVPDQRWGEVPLAVVVARAGGDLTAEALIGHCRELLARYKCPKAVEFVDELPRNASGKILKRELRNTYAGPTG